MTISILKTEPFQPLGPAIKRGATAPTPAPVQVRPGVFQGADGRMFTDFAVGQSVAPAPKASKPAPEAAAAPAAALGDGWIDCGPDMPDLKTGKYELRNVSTAYRFTPCDSLLNAVVPAFRDQRYQYRLLPQEAA